MSCKLCLSYTGIYVVHGHEGCSLGESTLCRKCGHRGHLGVHCTAPHPAARHSHFKRDAPRMPRYAPAPDNYSQYVADNGSSYYMYDEHDHHHLRDINTLIAPSPWDYDALGDFIKLHGVPVKRITKDSCEARMTAIESWAVSHGYRLIHTISVE